MNSATEPDTAPPGPQMEGQGPAGPGRGLRTAGIVLLFALVLGLGLWGGYGFFGRMAGRAGRDDRAVQKTPSEPLPGDVTRLRIFYPVGGRLQMEQREVRRVYAGKDLAEASVLEFLKGPSGGGETHVPQGAALLGVYQGSDGIIYIDLSDEFRSNFHGDVVSEFILLRALYESVMSNTYKVKGLKLLIDGREVQSVGGHILITRTLGEVVSQAMTEGYYGDE